MEMKETLRVNKRTQQYRRIKDRGTSEGGGRDKLKKKVDGDVPECMRH